MNFREIIKSDVFSGMLLVMSIICALIFSNSFLYPYFLKIIYFPINMHLYGLRIHSTLITVINHGLMAFFFLLIGLEMKRHLVTGQYQEKQKLVLPLMAAIGGLVVPALIYYSLNFDDKYIRGWAIPTATDTAFELAILSFFRRKISLDLRIFVLGFSLIDDILAITVLSIFYSKTITIATFLMDLLIVGILFLLNHYNIRKIRYYLFVGVILWIALEKSGVHGTLAGILVAVFIPIKNENNQISPLEKLEHNLMPYVNYLILPIFAFFNSELNIRHVILNDLVTNLSLGIMLGLFFGKQIGISLFSYVGIKLKYCHLPQDTSWLKFYAIALLGGVGFTLSLFIGGIAFNDQWALNTMKSAVIISSFVSAVAGIVFLKFLKDK